MRRAKTYIRAASVRVALSSFLANSYLETSISPIDFYGRGACWRVSIYREKRRNEMSPTDLFLMVDSAYLLLNGCRKCRYAHKNPPEIPVIPELSALSVFRGNPEAKGDTYILAVSVRPSLPASVRNRYLETRAAPHRLVRASSRVDVCRFIAKYCSVAIENATKRHADSDPSYFGDRGNAFNLTIYMDVRGASPTLIIRPRTPGNSGTFRTFDASRISWKPGSDGRVHLACLFR